MKTLVNGFNKHRKSVNSVFEALILVLTGIYLFWQISSTTQFQLLYPEWMEDTMIWALAIVAALRLLILGLKRKEAWIGLGVAAVYCLVYHSTHYPFLLFLAALTVGLAGIDYQKTLKLFVVIAGSVVCTAVIAGLCGAIHDYTYLRDAGIRSSLGMNYPTDFASIVLFIILFLWAVRKKFPDIFMLLCGIGSSLLAFFIAQSRTSFICSLVFIAAILYDILLKGLSHKFAFLQRVRKIINWIVSILFPLYAVIFFIGMFLYRRGTLIGETLNSLMSNRIKLAVEAFQEYGLKAFGTPFDMHGFGSNNFGVNDYNFVDSSYPLILLRYGWVLLLVLCVLWVWTVRKMVRNQNQRIVLVMGIIALHALSEHHMLDANYNLLVVMPLAAYPTALNTEQRAGWEKKKIISSVVTAGVFVLLGVLFLPSLMSRLKTVLQIKNLYGGAEQGWETFLTILFLLLIVVVMVWGFYRCLLFILKKKLFTDKKWITYILPFVIAVCITVIGLIYSGHLIQKECQNQELLLNQEQAELELAAAASTGGLYSDVLPSVYQQRVKGFQDSIFTGEELARYEHTTVLMDADTEQRTFFTFGYLYAQISDEHALYTNDEAVVNALMDAGYPVHGYFSYEDKIDLAYEADINQLEYLPEEGLLLDGTEHIIFYGTGINLFSGRYTAYYDLKLPEDMPRDDTVVCRLKISSEWGGKVLIEQNVLMSEFDENGKLTAQLPFNLSENTTGIELLAFTEEGQQLRVHDIRYGRTPDYDTHTFYNTRLQKIKESYYDLDGNPYAMTSGEWCVEYTYDDAGNNTSWHYLDINGNLMIRNGAYAELRREYNNKKQIIRESYYGTELQPLALTTGEAAVEYEYDNYGNTSVWRYYDIDNNLMIRNGTYAEMHREYDFRKQIIRESYYGTDQKPMALASGEHMVEYEYDDRGNTVEWRYYGTDGNLVIRNNAYAVMRREYNDEKQIIKESYYGTEEEPIELVSGEHSVAFEYDEAGNTTDWRYYDSDGNPTIRNHAYAEMRREYNDIRQIIRESYYGIDQEPLALSTGEQAIEYEYDTAGNTIGWRYYDTAGNLFIRNNAYAELRREYNERRQIIRESYYGVEREPIVLSTGEHAVEYEYDDVGNTIVWRYYGLDDQLFIRNNSYAEMRREYNDRKQVVRESYYGMNQEPIALPTGEHAVEYFYDNVGNKIEWWYYNVNGKLVLYHGAYAGMKRTYDTAKRVIEESYYGTNEAPIDIEVGYCRFENEYSSNGELLLSYYYNTEDDYVECGSGYFHEYLQALHGQLEADDITIFISAKDEFSTSMTSTLIDDLYNFGITSSLPGEFRNSFYAVIDQDGVVDAIGQEKLMYSGKSGDCRFEVTSAGGNVGGYSSILINGKEYSKNVRGLNIVVYDHARNEVIESIGFDTYVTEMTVTK